MLIQQIYKLAIELGISADPRGKKEVQRFLDIKNKKYKALKKDEKAVFDKDELINPYSDTRIGYDHGKQVKRILAGIDVDTGEVLLADRLSQGQGKKKIDMILGHHPLGMGRAGFSDVMRMQADMLHGYDIPINIAEGMLEPRIQEVDRGMMPGNHYKVIDSARLLGMGLMCCHSPADNNVQKHVQKLIDKADPLTLEDVLDVLKKVPEYKQAALLKSGPKILSGKKQGRAGKVVVEMTGGTSGPKGQYERMAKAGVGTIIEMHIKEDHLKEAKKNHLNVVIAGHIASDSLGMNLVLDQLEKKGIEVIPFSGLIRVCRNK